LNPPGPLQLPLQRRILTRLTPRSPLVLACTALLCTVLLAACGENGDSATKPKAGGAQAALEKTFGATATSIDRARVVAKLKLEPEGLLKLGGPIALKVTGPFAAPTADTPPRFDLAFLATLGGQQFKGGALSTGRRSFLRLDDRAYALGGEHTKTRRSADDDESHPGLKALGIDPLRWVTDVREVGSERVAGVDTTRLAGNVDAKRLLADVGELLDQAGGKVGSILSPELLNEIGAAVKSAKVDIWTGAGDSILRQLAVAVRFEFKPAQSPIVGLDGGNLTLRVRLDDVNGAPVRVTAPTGVRPLSEVTGEGGLGALLAGLGAGITGGIGGGAVELVGCVTKAAGSAVALVRCVSRLAP
jgi:hypothetical protein